MGSPPDRTKTKTGIQVIYLGGNLRKQKGGKWESRIGKGEKPIQRCVDEPVTALGDLGSILLATQRNLVEQSQHCPSKC